MLDWFGAFVFTQLFECPIYLDGLRRHPASLPRRAAVAFGASALTHPIVWFVIPRFVYAVLCDPERHEPRTCWIVMLVIAESFAFVAEALYLRAFGMRRPWLYAFAANATSFTLGLVYRELFGWP